MEALTVRTQEILHGTGGLQSVEVAGDLTVAGKTPANAGYLAHFGAAVRPLGKRCCQIAHDNSSRHRKYIARGDR